MREPIKPKVVVITGASAGVGRATARRFAEQGAAVGLLARGRDGLAAAEEEIRNAGGRALAIPLDVANFEQVMSAAERIEQELGPVDLWINNAMVSVLSPFREMTSLEFRRVTDVSYLGVVHGTLAALRLMDKRGRGQIIQVSSALSNRGIALQSAYCGAKHAINGFTESLRAELVYEKSDIQLTQVQLPALNTAQFSSLKNRAAKAMPFPPIYQPELAAKAIMWASRHNKRDVFVGLSMLKEIWTDKWSSTIKSAKRLERYLGTNGGPASNAQRQQIQVNPVWLMLGAVALLGAASLNRKLNRVLRG
jgi:NAD(P)-dependent dehydrogenase (short-subunit alcohol dehydrogenase family)